MTLAKLLIFMTVLAVIARTRVAVLPGWVVPAPAVFLMTAVMVCAVAITALVLRFRATRPRLRPGPAAPGSMPEVTS